MSPTLNANPTLFAIPCKFWGIIFKITMLAIIVTYQVIFLFQTSIVHDNISPQAANKRR